MLRPLDEYPKVLSYLFRPLREWSQVVAYDFLSGFQRGFLLHHKFQSLSEWEKEMEYDKSTKFWPFYLIHNLFRPLSEWYQVMANNKNRAAVFEMLPVNDPEGHRLRLGGTRPSKTSGNGVAMPPLTAANARRGLDGQADVRR